MSEEIDLNKMAAEFVSQNIERFYNTGKDVLKGAADTARLHLNRSYKDYLECVIERYSKAKSFFIRNEPTSLYDFYVPVGISGKRTKINKASIKTISAVNPFAVITGTGGSGKSMLLRHLLLNAVIQREKVPVFLELRELNQTEHTLTDFIISTLHSNEFTLDEDYIKRALKAGHFALLFDGFDEVALSLRDKIRKQLFQLTKEYDENVIIVSSRPDSELSGWPNFSIFQMDALTLEQALRLIGKLPFDSDLKSKFMKDLPNGLFEKHKSFLSNPLLLSMMLLTYGESADIPNKLSIFYGHAYETLFQRHDALKAGFRREHLTRLDIQDFARVFSAFSIQTYDVRAFDMPRTEALKVLERAKKIVNVPFEAADYLVDVEQAVCLLIEDGLNITFTHRSFQEFFAARFIADAKPDIQRQLIQKYTKNMRVDNVMDLLYEMKPDLVESAYIIPYLQKLGEGIGFKNKIGVTHYARYIKTDYSRARIRDGIVLSIVHATNHRGWRQLVTFTLKHCGHLVGGPGVVYTPPEVSLWEKYVEGKPDEEGEYEMKFPASNKSEFWREFGAGNGTLSMAALEYALKAKDALIQKHQSADRSIDEILLS